MRTKKRRGKREEKAATLEAFAFFREHAGGVVGAHAQCALLLARAEVEGKMRRWVFEWTEDPTGCAGCECESKVCPCSSGEAHETLSVVLRTAPGGPALTSLNGICGATATYRRVVEAELASEALHDIAEPPTKWAEPVV